LSDTFSGAYCEADGKPCSLPGEEKDFHELSNGFGAISLMDVKLKSVAEFLSELISIESSEYLWTIMNNIRGKSFEQVMYLGGNIATLLNSLGKSFSGKDLSSLYLVSADLRKSNLNNTNLRNCILRKADLRGCKFTRSAIKNAKFEESLITIFLSGENVGDFAGELRNRGYQIIYEISSNYIYDFKLIETPLTDSNQIDSSIVNTILHDYEVVSGHFAMVSDDFYLIILETSTENLNETEIFFSTIPSTKSCAIFSDQIERLEKTLSPELKDLLEFYQPEGKYIGEPMFSEAILHSIKDIGVDG